MGGGCIKWDGMRLEFSSTRSRSVVFLVQSHSGQSPGADFSIHVMLGHSWDAESEGGCLGGCSDGELGGPGGQREIFNPPPSIQHRRRLLGGVQCVEDIHASKLLTH